MELLIHCLLDQDMFTLGSTGASGAFPYGIQLGFKTSLESPYLLHQLLAFSARRLAFLHPERAPFYLHQAVSLQTRAVSLFNSAWTKVDESNCVAILLFSSILGHHHLADTLAKRDPGGLDAFLAHYIQCVKMHRGIYTIATSAWPLLMDSWLEPILKWSSGFTSRKPKGNTCQRLLGLINNCDSMAGEDKEACIVATNYLQVGFDAIFPEEEEQRGNRYHMIVSWTMLVPTEFTALLEAKQPEALVVLSYYALLLHYGRKMWQVDDAGVYLLGLIGEFLGKEWEAWLEYPRECIAGDQGGE